MRLKTIRKVEEETELEITGATLLSIEEAEALPYRLREYCIRWWTYENILADVYPTEVPCIMRDGRTVYGFPERPAGVRPALKIANLSSTDLKIEDSIFFDNKEFEIISDELAFCKTDIGAYHFREDYKAETSCYYEKSDVKKFVDEWFNEAKEKETAPETPSRECWGGCAYC